MTDLSKFSVHSFSQPYGPGQLYGPPPYAYRDARSLTAVWTATGSGIEDLLPPGVEVADAEPLVLATASYYPQSAFGCYSEFWLYVRVTFGDERFMYCVGMYTDSEKATASGRELWGFPKKMAHFTLRQTTDQWHFQAQRPAGHVLFEMTLVEERAGEAEIAKDVSLPVLSLRLIPHFTGKGDPDLAQLLATDNKKTLRKSALGTDELRNGRAHVSFQSTAADPFDALIPTKMLGAWFSNYDTDVPGAFKLVHDYKNPR